MTIAPAAAAPAATVTADVATTADAATDSSSPAAVSPDVDPGEALLTGISAVSDHQLPTGEIASFAPGADGRLAYRRSLWPSIAVHDALACFDPSSAWEETRCVRDLLPPPAMSRLCLEAARIRRRIRDFVAWQEPADRLWQEGGKHGGASADPGLTAAAAAALMDDPARAAARWPLYARALDRFRGADGRYRARVEGGDPAGRPAVDPTADALVTGFLALAGEDVESLAASLERDVEAAAADGRGEPPPLGLACAVARCWGRARLPGRTRLAASLVPGLLERLRGAPEGADPADRARVLLALIDLGSTAPEILSAARRMLDDLPLASGWASGGPAAGAVRCPALSRALVMAVAARSRVIAEEAVA